MTNFRNLQTGDTVVIDDCGSRFIIDTVFKVTKTQITTTMHRFRFMKSTGFLVGEKRRSWSPPTVLVDKSPEEAKAHNRAIDEANEKSRLARLITQDWKKLKELPLDTLQEVSRLLGVNND